MLIRKRIGKEKSVSDLIPWSVIQSQLEKAGDIGKLVEVFIFLNFVKGA